MTNESFVSQHKKITTSIIYSFTDCSHMPIISERRDGDAKALTHLYASGHIVWKREFQLSYSHLVVFPVFFDLLDLYVDELYPELTNENFGHKVSILKNDASFFGSILHEVYKNCVAIRNKLIHHAAMHSDQGLSVSLGKNGQLFISRSKFRLINELIFMLVNYKNANVFVKNSALNAYCSVFGGGSLHLPEDTMKEFEYIQLSLPEASRYFRVRELSEDSMNISIFDMIAVPAAVLYSSDDQKIKDRFPDPKQKIVPGNYTYLLKHKADSFLIPSELINKYREITFRQLSGWEC